MSSPTPEAVTADPGYRLVKDYLIAHTGLAYYSDRDRELARIIARRMGKYNLRDCLAFLSVLRSGAEADLELNTIVAELTIGETYFFRHPEQFEALREIVFPEILARKQAAKQLRIWSAGCANGAEAYSVAILLKQEFEAQLRDWSVLILGTDIDHGELTDAREGYFSEWTLRTTSRSLREECFVREGKMWRIRPKYKEWTIFSYHNLVQDEWPPFRAGAGGFDLILCRNVMIYFSQEIIAKLMANLSESLASHGWLIVGHAELTMQNEHALRVLHTPTVTLLQKEPTQPQYSRAGDVAFEAAPFEASRPPEEVFVPGPGPRPAGPVPPSDSDIAELRILADTGRWEEAERCCEKLLERDPSNAEIYYYCALVAESRGRYADAEIALRQALALRSDFVLAQYQLGVVLEKRDHGKAQQVFHEILNALDRLPGHLVLEAKDGLTVAGLRELTSMQLHARNDKGRGRRY